MSYSIAIDGPSGAGKSTIAKRIAKRLGCIYVDTGAMYRATALFMLRNGIKPEDQDAVSGACDRVSVTLRYENDGQVVLLNGENVNGLIRTEEVGMATSLIARYPKVRERTVEKQRQMAKDCDLIMDGRDIGTCVLPGATAKIYLTASSAVRAKRRYEELLAKGEDCDYNTIEADIIKRDEQDMNREISPLRQAEDAVLVDSSDMTIDQVVETIIAICRRKGCR